MPSKILVLVCLTIVRRYRPDWLAVSAIEAARELDVNHERLSRLATTALAGLEKVLALLTRRGRPPKDRAADVQAQHLSHTQALLGVASGLLAYVSWRKPAVRALVVGAYLRLQQEPPQLTQKAFCEALSLPSRTLRCWLAHPEKDVSTPSTPIAPTPPTAPPRSRLPRRPRFGFNIVLPETQLAGDTTDLTACGCPLKLIATQDVGGRDENLLQSIIVDDHESADIVVRAFTEAIDGREGFQAIVDQGTPYMAQKTRDALDALGAELAPQVEGTPTDKATIERAFETVKTIAAPLLAVTNRIAEKIPALRQTRLAIALTTILLTALLKAYQAGARAQHRAAQERQGLSRKDMLDAAQEHRESSRAEDRSRLLLLRFIHDAYDIKRPVTRFVRSLRRFPLVVLRRAETAFGTQVHRDDIRDRASYFCAIVRNVHQDYRAEQARHRADQEQRARLQASETEQASRLQARHESPESWLKEALGALAVQWQPATRQILYGGIGLGRRWLIDALALLIERHGREAARDIATGIFHDFSTASLERLGGDGITAIRSLLEQHLPLRPQDTKQTRCTQDFAAAILPRAGSIQRPAPKGALSNLPARPGGS